jgi:ribosomal protein L31
MAKKIHPQEFNSTVVCMTCNHNFSVASSKKTTDKSMRVNYCCFCSSFYTGKMQFSAGGRVSRFERHQAIAKKKSQESKIKDEIKIEQPLIDSDNNQTNND